MNVKQTDLQKINLWLPKGNTGLGGMGYTSLYKKQINNKDLLYNTGKYIQYLVIIYSRK